MVCDFQDTNKCTVRYDKNGSWLLEFASFINQFKMVIFNLTFSLFSLTFSFVVLEKKTPIESGIYRFKVKDGSYIGLQTTTYSFTNPWTKEIEYIVANHTVES